MKLSGAYKDCAVRFRERLGKHEEDTSETFPYLHTTSLNHKMWIKLIRDFLENPAEGFESINECINFASWQKDFEGTMLENTPGDFYTHMEEEQPFEHYNQSEIDILKVVLRHIVSVLQGTDHLKKDLKDYG